MADAASLQEDLDAFGLPADTFARAAHEPAEGIDQCTVDAENWPTVQVFLALATQWRKVSAGMSGEVEWQGLRYSEAATVISLFGYQAQAAAIFEGLLVMESAALPLLNKR